MFDLAPVPLFSTIAGLCSSYVVGQIVRANIPATTGLFQEVVVKLGSFGIGGVVSKVVTENWQEQITLAQRMYQEAQEEASHRR